MKPQDLVPRVKGQLSAMEAAALSAIKNGEKFRTTIGINPEVALAIIRAADRADRDFSNFTQVLFAAHARTNPEPDDELSEVFSVLEVAASRNPSLKADLRKMAIKANRRARVLSAA